VFKLCKELQNLRKLKNKILEFNNEK